MAKVIVLGGAGAVGSVAVKTLARHPEFSEVVIGDFNAKRSEELRSQIGSPKVTYTPFNAHDTESIHRAI
ncbi:MAG TPA: saccharopine dehydrogenase NADP-binding domain-containing protein, partial [Spirochaetota bacterium]|nr:saccharopine dehydrogenase NADP-binding domain-containing protein [Spirochaetota bacterium]